MSKQFLLDQINQYYDLKEAADLQKIEEYEAAQWGIQLPQAVIVQQVQALDIIQKPLLTKEMVEQIASFDLEVPERFTLGSEPLEDFFCYCTENPSVQTELMADIVAHYLQIQ